MRRLAMLALLAVVLQLPAARAVVSQPTQLRCVALDDAFFSECGYTAHGPGIFETARLGPWKVEVFDLAHRRKLIDGGAEPRTLFLPTVAGDEVWITLNAPTSCPGGPPVGTLPKCGGGPAFAFERA